MGLFKAEAGAMYKPKLFVVWSRGEFTVKHRLLLRIEKQMAWVMGKPGPAHDLCGATSWVQTGHLWLP